jgi:hypothetical protein
VALGDMNFAEANASLVPVKHDLALSMQLVCFAWKLLARGRLRRAWWRPPWPPDTKDLRKGSSLPGELNRRELGQLGLEIFDASMDRRARRDVVAPNPSPCLSRPGTAAPPRLC